MNKTEYTVTFTLSELGNLLIASRAADPSTWSPATAGILLRAQQKLAAAVPHGPMRVELARAVGRATR